ncbi:replication factor A protein 1-like [Senna tora]|uniref:Replication factor A protein 1-like n=1 Tax=Senna tora TaxID=362788 RepID=A0A834WJR2_9FABA|nr:replication factor A protein 1-like [Senna tora]
MRNFSGGRIIIAIKWCKVADLNGSKYLTTSMDATRLLINEGITCFDDLPVEFQQLELKEDIVRNIHLPDVSSEHTNQPFSNIQLKTISELFISFEYSVHFIMATVIKVNTSMDWYYYVCEFCIEELDFEEECYYCYNCGKSLSTPSISDDPLKHTIFLESLLHKVFLIKIFVNEASCIPMPSFEVLSMSWDASLIERWSDKVVPSSNVYMSTTYTNSHSDDKSQDESSPTSPIWTTINQLTRPHNNQGTSLDQCYKVRDVTDSESADTINQPLLENQLTSEID